MPFEPFRPTGVVTLTTDFGTRDGYVGAMKGVLLREHAAVRTVDVTHDVPAQDLAAGAFALAQAAPHFPTGTIHVAVVDPGVGSSRRALAIEHAGSLFVGPDNGLFTLVAGDGLAPGDAVFHALDALPAGWPLSSTFHGRDLFARVAGRLAAGDPIAAYSRTTVDDPVALPWPRPRAEGQAIVGAIVHVDRFGNLVTSVTGRSLDERFGAARPPDEGGALRVEIAGARAPLCRTFADVERGEPVAYVGSAGLVEVAVRDGSARERLGVDRGQPVRVLRAG